MKDQFKRSQALLGDKTFNSLQNKRFCVIGLGGVGGTAFEALIRTGAQHIVGIDFDKVDVTNLNRQLLYTRKDVGMYKANCAFARAKDINEEVDVETLQIKISEDTLKFLDHYQFDYMIDAIDDLSAKVLLVKYCLAHHITFISSLGMGNRISGQHVTITKLNKTHDCPLAKKFRYLLKNEGIDLNQVLVIFSEDPLVHTDVDYVSSVMMSPSSAGLVVVSYIIEQIRNENA